MHFCGNFWHDAPLYIALAIPALAPVVLWLRAKLGLQHTHANDGTGK